MPIAGQIDDRLGNRPFNRAVIPSGLPIRTPSRLQAKRRGGGKLRFTTMISPDQF
jgi:hypothetical protein